MGNIPSCLHMHAFFKGSETSGVLKSYTLCASNKKNILFLYLRWFKQNKTKQKHQTPKKGDIFKLPKRWQVLSFHTGQLVSEPLTTINDNVHILQEHTVIQWNILLFFTWSKLNIFTQKLMKVLLIVNQVFFFFWKWSATIVLKCVTEHSFLFSTYSNFSGP